MICYWGADVTRCIVVGFLLLRERLQRVRTVHNLKLKKSHTWAGVKKKARRKMRPFPGEWFSSNAQICPEILLGKPKLAACPTRLMLQPGPKLTKKSG